MSGKQQTVGDYLDGTGDAGRDQGAGDDADRLEELEERVAELEDAVESIAGHVSRALDLLEAQGDLDGSTEGTDGGSNVGCNQRAGVDGNDKHLTDDSDASAGRGVY
ncbi:hypothetical protein [Natronococcus jeotgali]|uniref:Uncharacterized protein n=1 Tax=Natronococcus jeotgali DSM 18795 TaxID=1227498 RepID=L9XY18_9EURY|nr:hypothetical protein [Natronococcus jeotgali]ELY66729.1 hypothetical protein C492_00459 [Natronococcus jeotgali DSM 18795]